MKLVVFFCHLVDFEVLNLITEEQFCYSKFIFFSSSFTLKATVNSLIEVFNHWFNEAVVAAHR